MRKLYFLFFALFICATTKASIISESNFVFKPIIIGFQQNYFLHTNSVWSITTIAGNNTKTPSQLEEYTLIPDVNFETKLLSLGIDSGSVDGKVLTAKVKIVKSLHIPNSNISDLTGIQDFVDLNYLDCSNNLLLRLDVSKNINLDTLHSQNNNLTSLNISSNILLESLWCFESKLTTLDISKNVELQTLWCWDNQLTSLDLTNNTKLEIIDCENNRLIELNISKQLDLTELNCGFNQLSSLNVSNNLKISRLVCNTNNITELKLSNLSDLTELICGQNPLNSIDISKNLLIKYLWIGYTDIQSLDLSSLKELNAFAVSNCPNLEYINVKNGIIEDLLFYEEALEDLGLEKNNLSNCPKLKYICGDDSQLNALSQRIASYNYTNCIIGDYCSFNPGSVYYAIKGISKIDSNNNGCDAQDIVLPNMKFSISDGTNNSSFIGDSTGNYALPVSAGVQTIKPVLENSDYYSVSPAFVSVDFPTQTSPLMQDFCIIPNGLHPDLEIKLLPLEAARPGFDVRYKILFKNKGNVSQSGTVSLNFDDTVLDLLMALPSQSTQAVNSLVWNFTDLKPFETKEILITLNVNSPMETPAVNNGDLLKFSLVINSIKTDDTPIDNSFYLNQEVVGSFDPNDKTCLEGNTVTPNLIGEFVNYIIRFENTGNYPAQNVVVKDVIDLTKFDINSLVPIDASHSFVTRISGQNKVEFIFENINLPFVDTANDGYIAFKIKTLSSLVVGDSFTNEANIYFDYNFPILTNKVTSTFKTLGKPDFEFSNYFTLYPNPAESFLNISSKNNIELSSICIYDILGKLILAVPDAKGEITIDVSNLAAGSYFIKLNSNIGSTSSQFIKK